MWCGKKGIEALFEWMEEDVDKFKARWYQTLSFLAMGNSLYSMEGLGYLVDYMIDV